MSDLPRTLGELRASGYQSRSVKDEMRANLLTRLVAGSTLFPGILGFDETVIPQVQNAILSQHDMLFLGLRGQGKTRMLRMLVALLDEVIPVVAGSEMHDDPLRPVSKFARERIASEGDGCPVEWLGREDRYNEKLATPDVTIADLVGEIDLIKHAEGQHLSNEDVLHFGLVPRSHRGIFCMNELPDLSPKIQVGLFNVLEERDVQIRGFPVRLDLDLCMVFSANPEDYTNRGRLVTPLKDRIGSVIRTHYPPTREIGVRITDENAWVKRDGPVEVLVPCWIKDVVEEFARLARSSPHVNQQSGVSVRMSMANMENVVSSAERRAVVLDQQSEVVRVSDLMAVRASSRGKMELTMSEEPGEEDGLVARLIGEAVRNVFDLGLSTRQFRDVVEYFETGAPVSVGDAASADDLLGQVATIPGFVERLDELVVQADPELYERLGSDETRRQSARASMAEFVLEALHCHNRLNKVSGSGMSQYES
ncbi:MAG TPA: magnesium chelatase [Planctomycetaceae bacterium]|nr:magnesium chelatase [Planctomycetaceae bacterium]